MTNQTHKTFNRGFDGGLIRGL